MKIVSSLLPEQALQEAIQKKFPEIQFQFFKGMKNAFESFQEAEVFMTYGEDLTEELIHSARNLRWIMVMSAGLEKMPLAACEEKGILVTNARGVHKIPMAEFTLGAMLQYVKQTKLLSEREADENWDRKIPMAELCGKTILILGVGAIGGEIARLAKAFRMNTIGVNRSGDQVDYVDELYTMKEVPEVIEKADFIVSVLPSTDETSNVLTYEHFQAMKNTAVFINIGRGDLVKDETLLKALENNEIAHAYLDVFEQEPLPKGHSFWKMENVTVTPHLSSITKNYLPRAFEIFEQNLHTYNKKGVNYKNRIDLSRGY
ncbi:D-2-hydroxyacid dehydrogenase [Robertmurraya yapensis]|uniref:D-2-hydroxyacid dehydrogenase n=2 Tax=Bacillaceae TaxID=186817 RepID=A0A431VSQ9_9BACI|nr:D-2-hydroxyacid dehydrogenase [Bacillus yapensis]RTR26143.1 D-2-hydroxyacid dehydrogenase [Bacillus yapensis]TKS93581.1 D-2-hydroxyacid dehydrogenase [Bacillus yapensis]